MDMRDYTTNDAIDGESHDGMGDMSPREEHAIAVDSEADGQMGMGHREDAIPQVDGLPEDVEHDTTPNGGFAVGQMGIADDMAMPPTSQAGTAGMRERPVPPMAPATNPMAIPPLQSSANPSEPIAQPMPYAQGNPMVQGTTAPSPWGYEAATRVTGHPVQPEGYGTSPDRPAMGTSVPPRPEFASVTATGDAGDATDTRHGEASDGNAPAPKQRRWPWVLGGIAVGGIVASLVTALALGGFPSLGGLPSGGSDSAEVISGDGERGDWGADVAAPISSRDMEANGTASAVAKRCLPSVVAVHVSDGTNSGLGSGVIIDSEGRVITNSHVVKGMSEIVIVTGDGEDYVATLKGLDDSSDLAVLDVDWEGQKVTAMEWGNSDELSVGDWVMTIGSPYGLDQSVSSGIVSALSRNQIMDSYDGYRIYAGLIQTDAAINMGNSGGALVDSQGRLVGINSMLASNSGSSAGVGFAIPGNYAQRVAEQIIAGREVEHAYIGGSFGDVSRLGGNGTSYGIKENGTPDEGKSQYTNGAYVASVVQGDPADQAGIKEGDIITKFDGERITSASSLIMAIRAHNPGEEVEVTLVRDGQEVTVKVTLGSDSGKGLYDEDGQRVTQQQQQRPQGWGYGQPFGGNDGNDYPMTDEELKQFFEQFSFPFGNPYDTDE